MGYKTTRNKGSGRLALFCSFYKKYLQNLKYNVPKDMSFSFNFAWDSIQLVFFIKSGVEMKGGGLGVT